MVNLKFNSFNVRGLRDKVKRKTIFYHLKHKYPGGVYLLQEVHSLELDVNDWSKEWKGDSITGFGGKSFFHHGDSDSRGVAILLSDDLDVKTEILFKDNEGRILIIKLTTTDDIEYLVCNIYAPTRNKVQEQLNFLEILKIALAGLCPLNLVLGGDFNTVFNPALDKQGGDLSNCINAYTHELVAFMESNELTDVIRVFHPNRKIFTRTQRKPPVLSRIDHWLISAHLLNLTEKVNVFPGLKSDHSIIHLHLSSESLKRGRGYYKFNSNLLKDIEYVNEMNDLIERLKIETELYEDKRMRWEFIKTEIAGSSMKYSASKAKRRREMKKHVEDQLKIIEDKLTNNINTSDLDLYNSLKNELENITEMETNGAIMRSRIGWAEAGEKNTKFFLNLEKRNAMDKHICKLETQDGKVITEPKDILKEQRCYYETLYSLPRQNQDFDFNIEVNKFTHGGLSSLSEADKNICEGIITEQDCKNALKDMKMGKSPGCDGLTVEFYIFFWLKIKSLVIESINEGFDKGELSVNQKRGIITLIPKKGKIRTLLKNWRPISLLNIDYKILTKCLAHRLQKVLPNIIDTDQTGFLKLRYIGENIRTISDIIEFTSLKNQPGIILLLDFEKAFDTILWPFLIESLRQFNFGPMFIRWVETIYNNIESTVLNNGHTTGFFQLHRGIRQGCPLSPYLFIIAVEILANAIRKDKDIKGIPVGDTILKVSQLADDTTLFVSDFPSIKAALDLIENFRTVSGLSLNVNKTIAKCIGSLDDNIPDSLYGLEWTNGPIRTLGLTLSNDPDTLYKENFLPRLKQFDNVLNIWHCRGLSLKGKVTVLKSLALPKLLYPMSVLPIPTNVVKIVDDMIIDFIWSKRRPKIKRDVVIQNIENGGIKVPSFEAMVESNRIAWIKRILSNSDTKWKCILKEMIKPFTLMHFTENFLDNESIDSIKIPFFTQVYGLWNHTRSPPSNRYEYFEQIIWNNRFIQLPSGPKRKSIMKSLSWLQLYKSGISKVKDIINPDGSFKDIGKFCQDNNIKYNFLQIIRLRKAIPVEWLSVISTSFHKNLSIDPPNSLLMLKTDKKCIDICNSKGGSISKKIYNYIIETKVVQPTAVGRWHEIFEIDTEDWPRIYSLPYVASRDTKLQSMQYKIIHRIISCQKWLYNQKVSNSPYCEHCVNKIEDIPHLFTECCRLNNFWDQLEKWWNRTAAYGVKITNKHIIFGLYYDNKMFSEINYTILLAKWFIRGQYYKECRVDFYDFLAVLKYNLNIEKIICTNIGNLVDFNKKWANILEKL